MGIKMKVDEVDLVRASEFKMGKVYKYAGNNNRLYFIDPKGQLVTLSASGAAVAKTSDYSSGADFFEVDIEITIKD